MAETNIPDYRALMRILKSAAAIVLLIQLAACSGNYDGPVTNAPPPAGANGPPLLNGEYAP